MSEPVVAKSLSEKFSSTMRGMGAIVFWEMSDTRITPDDLRSVLAMEGIQIQVPDIDPEGAIKRASRTWAMGRGVDRYRSDPVDIADANRVKVCILHRQEEGAAARKAAKWETVESVIFDLPSRTWTASASTPEVQSFIALCDDYMKHLDHNFLRPNVIQKQLAEMKAFSLKASSGLWYATQDQMGSLAALQRVVSAIGSSAMYVIHVGESDQSRDAIQSAARGALTETLAELEARLDSWVASTRKIRSDAIDTALTEFAELVDRTALYQGALQVRMDDLSLRIDAAKSRAREIIDGNLSSHADPSTKPLGKRAIAVLEVIEQEFPAPATFTLRALEEILGVEPGNGSVQTHLRDCCRLGKTHRCGREESGAMLYSVGPGDGSGPGEEPEKVEIDEAETKGGQDVELVDAAQAHLPVEPEPAQAPAHEVTPEPAPEVTPELEQVIEPERLIFPDDEELAQMDRDSLRRLADQLKEHGVVIKHRSRLGRNDLAAAISAARG